VFGVSGGEIVDTAIKLARAHTGRMKIISALGGYHGHTGLALAAGDEQYRKPFGQQLAGFVQVAFDDLEALETEIDDDTAAVILETIPATLGMPIPAADYFAGVRRLCDQHGAVMIIDEVQTGLGRCGAFWGIDSYGVIPDIIVTGKGLSGGIYPITAMIYSDELQAFFHNNAFIHISTFGGAELGCVVALEVLAMLKEPDFLTHVDAMAKVFEKGFADLKQKHPRSLVETRQRGLMMALKMANDSAGMMMSMLGFQHGIFTVYANNDKSVSQILPPLIIQEDEALTVLSALDAMLSTLEAIQ
jgi:putrescine aminotransferase